jgi:hypothetical protein
MLYGYADGLDLARLRLKQLAHPFDTAPLGVHQEQCLAVCAAQHAREAGGVESDSFQHFAAFAYA